MGPIDLSEYSACKRHWLKERGHYCVYVASGESGPVKIGYAFDPVERLAAMQHATWQPLFMRHILWTPGKPVAMRVEEKALDLLTRAGKKVRGEWFNVPVEWAVLAVENTARNLYPSVNFVGSADMIRRLRERYIDQADHQGLDGFRKNGEKDKSTVNSNRVRARDLWQINPKDAAEAAQIASERQSRHMKGKRTRLGKTGTYLGAGLVRRHERVKRARERAQTRNEAV